MRLDFSPDQEPAALVEAIWEARRSNRRDYLSEILLLLDHTNSTVREEVVSLVFVKWSGSAKRNLLERVIGSDEDAGVRARAVGALAITTGPATREDDISLLREIVLNRREDEQVRKAAYEGVATLVSGRPVLISDDVDLDEDIDLEWVRTMK